MGYIHCNTLWCGGVAMDEEERAEIKAFLRALGSPEEAQKMRDRVNELYEAKHRKEWLWASIKVLMTWTALTAVAVASTRTMLGDLREWLVGWMGSGGK